MGICYWSIRSSCSHHCGCSRQGQGHYVARSEEVEWSYCVLCVQGSDGDSLAQDMGHQATLQIIEDGDRKGNQSNKGKQAKRDAKLKATVLPPRTPCWMPLDYSIWKAIVQKLVETFPSGIESKSAFLARLRKSAKTLARGTVASSIRRMRKQILGVKSAKGYHPKSD